MAAELPRPGVEVIQVFRTVEPTVVAPTLVPCVVGVCKQIVDVLVASASGSGSQLNPEALISLPGFLKAAAAGSPAVYTSLDAGDLYLSINGGVASKISFVGTSLTPAAVVAEINAQFAEDGVTEAIAEVSADGTYFTVRTIGVGEFSTVEVTTSTASAILTEFDWVGGYVGAGQSSYAQYQEQIPVFAFPNPRDNLSELAIESDAVRVFLGTGSGSDIREVSTSTSHLRHTQARYGGSAASVVGTVDITGAIYPLGANVLTVVLDGGTAVNVTLTGAADAGEVLQKINAALFGVYASLGGVNLVITSKTKGTASSVTLSGTAIVTLGLSGTTATGLAGVTVVDDGNGDSVSPLVEVYGEDFTGGGGSPTITGVGDLSLLTYPTDLEGKTLTLSVNGMPPQTLVFVDTVPLPLASETDIAAQIGALWPALMVALDLNNQLVLTVTETGEDAAVHVLGGTALGALGLVPSVVGETDLALFATALETLFNTKKLKIDANGTTVEHTFAALPGASTPTNIVTNLNANPAFAAVAVADLVTAGPSSYLRIRLANATKPTDYIRAMPATSADSAYYFGFDASGTKTYLLPAFGVGLDPLAGDDLYVDGVLVGRITSVAANGVTSRLRVNKQITINSDYGTDFYIIARNLSDGVSGRPQPELVVDASGEATVKPFILRDTTGAAAATRATVYLAYTAVRQDVTAIAASPSLLRFDSTTQLDTVLAPINGLNPLALGLYFALLNAPGAQVSGMGVDAISASYPYGTVEAFTRAAEALEQYEVYAIAPLTHDETVAQVFNAHVTSMSASTAKGERICLFNFSQPTSKLDTLVASGLTGNTIGSLGLTFDTGIANLAALLLAQGVNPVGTIPTTEGVFLFVASSANHYSVESIAGSVVTLRKTFTGGDNDDAFYSTTGLEAIPATPALIDEPFSIKVRGETLTVTGTTLPDKTAIAETMQARAQGYANRRFWSVTPDRAAATLGGVEQIIEGFYLTAGIAGMIGQQPPQQSFTNFPMTGYTRVLGSNDYFTERQLNVIAAGGNYIVVQDSVGVPLTSRMALTTDMTSLETRTDSITKIVDFTAKFMRRGLRSYIGRFNITQGFLDSLGHVCQGLLGFLTDIGVLIGANLNNIVQDENAPDTVLIDVTLDVPFPCNYIRLTLVI